MHELSLCESILRIIEEHAARDGFARVRKVRLALGALSCAEPESLHFGFSVVTKGTVADGAALEIEVRPGTAWCWDCQVTVPLADRTAGCPRCGGFRLQVQSGDEMRLTELDVE